MRMWESPRPSGRAVGAVGVDGSTFVDTLICEGPDLRDVALWGYWGM